MSDQATLLMLAFEFPPFPGVGAQRSVKLAKYLPEHGVRPVVITTDAASLEAWYGPGQDTSLLSELPDDVLIRRVPCPRPRPSGVDALRRLQAFLSLGEGIGDAWAAPLSAVFDAVVRETAAAAIYVSIPPFSVAPLALQLARRSGLPLILDFRDHWSQWCHNARPTRAHYLATLLQERRCVMGADAVVGVTTQLIRDLQAVHPQADRRKLTVIPNGFDGEVGVPAAREPVASSPFVIGYVGSFYYSPEMRASVMDPWWTKSVRHWPQYSPRREDWLYRSPFYFFRALARLLERRPELRSRIEVAFAGDPQDWLTAQVQQFQLGDVVRHVGRLSHQKSLEFQARCDALLVTSVKVHGGRDYCIAGKTFEYLTSGKPILGVVTEGEQQDFLRASGGAIVADADDVDATASAIEQLVDGRPVEPARADVLARFHRRETAKHMAAIVHQVARRMVARVS